MHDKIWQTNDVIYENGNHTLLSATEPSVTSVPCPWTCELTNDVGYVVYSALGSFYIPMFVMLFFYWRIYMAAIRTTRAIRQGFKTTKGRNCLFAYLFSLSHFTFWIFSSKFLILFSFSKWRLHCLKYSWFFLRFFVTTILWIYCSKWLKYKNICATTYVGEDYFSAIWDFSSAVI